MIINLTSNKLIRIVRSSLLSSLRCLIALFVVLRGFHDWEPEKGSEKVFSINV